MKNLLTAATLLTLITFAACQGPTDRNARILNMAGEEAAGIPNKLDRLTRQLNIAFIQLNASRQSEADAMLLLARDTLAGAAKTDMDDFHRIGGWTAIAQLAIRAKDRDLALKSADLAQGALNDVTPVADRATYVQSLSWVLAEVRDKHAAVELINSGGSWASQIPETNNRRQALTAFAWQLFDYDAFENARTMLKNDQDAAWRTDALVALSYTVSLDGDRLGGSAATAREVKINTIIQVPSGINNYGKDVRFQNVFQH